MTMPKVHVKKGDNVLVITGKSKGKQGKVLEVQPKENRIVVEGVNVVKKHSKPNQKSPQGGIIEKEAPIHASNVMLVCSKCNKPTRHAHKELDNGNKVRACKHCGTAQDK